MSSRLHKSRAGRPGAGPWPVALLEVAGAQAPCRPSDLLRKARERAEEIIRKAMDSARAAALAAEERGFEEGRKQGYEAGAHEAQSRVDEAHRELDLAAEQRRVAIREAEPQVARLAIEVASLILKREIGLDPAAAVSLVKDAIARVEDGTAVTVRVSPSSAAVLAPLCSDPGTNGRTASLRFEEDPALEPGDCVIETSRGMIDERIATQLERVATAFGGVDRHG